MHDTLERLKSCRGRNCSIRRQLPQLGMSAAATPPTAVNHVQRSNKRKHSKHNEWNKSLITSAFRHLLYFADPLSGSVGNFGFVGSRLDMDMVPSAKRRKLSKYHRQANSWNTTLIYTLTHFNSFSDGPTRRTLISSVAPGSSNPIGSCPSRRCPLWLPELRCRCRCHCHCHCLHPVPSEHTYAYPTACHTHSAHCSGLHIWIESCGMLPGIFFYFLLSK